MPGALLWGWDNTNKVWIPLVVDANGYVQVDMSNINLDDLADVSVASPTNGDIFYYNSGTGLWKSKAHTALKTGVHGVGAAYLAKTSRSDQLSTFLALFDSPASYSGQAGKVPKVNAGQTALEFGLRTKMTLEVSASDVFSESAMGTTPFTGKINGSPSATSVVYDTDTGENSLPWGGDASRMVLHNTTRGNSRLIVTRSLTTNTITTESSVDDWADNDDITTQSQVNTQAGYVDLDLSALIAATVTGLFLLCFWKDTGAIGEVLRWHPYEAYSLYKSVPLWNKTTTLYDTLFFPLPVISQSVTFLCTSSGAATSFPVVRYFGKFEDNP